MAAPITLTDAELCALFGPDHAQRQDDELIDQDCRMHGVNLADYNDLAGLVMAPLKDANASWNDTVNSRWNDAFMFTEAGAAKYIQARCRDLVDLGARYTYTFTNRETIAKFLTWARALNQQEASDLRWGKQRHIDVLIAIKEVERVLE